INASERNERISGLTPDRLFPYYGATGQVGWIDGVRTDGERVLLGEDGAPFLDPSRDKAYLVRGKFWVNNHAHVLAGRAGLIDNWFLCHQLNTVDFHPFVSGSTRLKLTSAAMKRIPLVIPPFNEQTRIVAKLEELLSDLDAGVAELRAAQAKLAQYRQSLLKAAVEGALTADWRARHTLSETGAQLLARILAERRSRWESRQLARFQAQGKTPPKGWQSKYPEPVASDTRDLPELPEGWVWASAEQLAELLSGHTPKGADAHASSGGAIHWFKVGDMNREGNESWLTTAQTRFNETAALDLGLKIAPAGTIVFPKRGGAIATNKKRRLSSAACFDLNTMGLIPCDSSAEWLWWWFQGIDLGRLSDGSNVPQINNPDIAPLPVPVPPAAEQAIIIDCLETGFRLIASQTEAIEIALKQSAAQRQNLLKAAFSGQLVPQDPADEPASALLERIRNGKTKTANQPTRRLGARVSA
ncbi:MAG: restriction endonuclease subunit S, partial [Proteobacteria bacterium]|nr:restriction endonuclease subunit S [Pseudomonadota bacterium]